MTSFCRYSLRFLIENEAVKYLSIEKCSITIYWLQHKCHNLLKLSDKNKLVFKPFSTRSILIIYGLVQTMEDTFIQHIQQPRSVYWSLCHRWDNDTKIGQEMCSFETIKQLYYDACCSNKRIKLIFKCNSFSNLKLHNLVSISCLKYSTVSVVFSGKKYQ